MSTQSELPHPINIHARLRALERTPQLSKDLNQKHGDGIALRRQINVSEILEKHLAETRNTVKSLSGQLPDLERGVKMFVTSVSATDTDAGPWQAEQEPYVRFSSSLYGLHSIAYPSRKVRVDLCILGPRSTAEKGSLGHVTRNLFLATKPIFDSVTTAGREVIARLERDKVGLNGDVTDVIESLDSSDPPLFVASTETIPATASTKSRAGSIASSAPRLTVVTV
ncbi:hypothetical protein E8E11_002689 [Didymella keratinophila]|nr:hypothetical protein E8E11_002689 [Didymella keratinophila]